MPLSGPLCILLEIVLLVCLLIQEVKSLEFSQHPDKETGHTPQVIGEEIHLSESVPLSPGQARRCQHLWSTTQWVGIELSRVACKRSTYSSGLFLG